MYRYYDPEKSVVILEYTMHGTVVRTGAPYLNRFISVITVKDRKITHWRDYLDPLAGRRIRDHDVARHAMSPHRSFSDIAISS